ncbi:anaerobic sulfatase maturase [Fictibacillus phosphorivorans]|uniref:anaerobic sulfatase maturase n=1 Tax=Fictibacillus phosphorivorans TaxID=1221500 RepID=UPI00203BA1AF|nr:anaerobic sulfatase maturase [Fictibacillus phosphorivorans]MCM3717628.1 anaerobic sulfatase maturase [Fictibacillus phosphorivorans]MCM3775528.1 anaerobic sulfatase maturase [Fictibacillus phosphorivorans]
MDSCATVQKESFAVMWKTVSEACNLACDYCYYSRCNGNPGKFNAIDLYTLEKFIKEYMELANGQAAFVWQGGEPLLAGLDFFQNIIQLQEKYAPPYMRISNSVQTNATLITREWAKFFKNYHFLVGVSLDGPQHIHDSRRVTGSGKGSFNTVMEGINLLKEQGVQFNILTVIHEGNVGKAADLLTFYEEQQFEYVQFIPCMDFRAQETEKNGTYLITDEEYGNFLCEAFDHWYNEGNPRTSIRFFDNLLDMYLHQNAEICIHRQSCPKMLVLEQNGDAYPCDFYINDEYKLGNVGTNSLKSILSHPTYETFLNLKPDLPDKCKRCEYLNLCHGGCPRSRMEQGRDVDYFCESYKMLYRYADVRMRKLAEKVKIHWLEERIKRGTKLPNRNDCCSCGSRKKFKKCCGKLLNHVTAGAS